MKVGEDEKIVTLYVPCLGYLFLDNIKCRPSKTGMRTHLCIQWHCRQLACFKALTLLAWFKLSVTFISAAQAAKLAWVLLWHVAMHELQIGSFVIKMWGVKFSRSIHSLHTINNSVFWSHLCPSASLRVCINWKLLNRFSISVGDTGDIYYMG
jgi:hypothetical protein